MSAALGSRSERIQLICFAALAAVAALQWTSLVADPPAGRVTLAVLVATAAGAGVAAIGRLRRSGRARLALSAAATALAICLALVLVGLPARMLLPAHWGELASNVGRSLDGLADIPTPYEGADIWTRLVILIAAPLVVGTAALAAFWPARRRATGRILALVLLVGLYLVSIAWETPDRQLAEGALLLLLVCAWLWLPDLRAGGRSAAAVALGGVALVAVPIAAAIDPGRALIDYRHWNLLSADAVSYRWDQSYGPLNWPQRGTRLLEVASDGAHYWKATNLDSFNGISWVRAAPPDSEPALGQPLAFHPKGTRPRPNPDWIDRINLDVRGLSSPVAVGAGTVLAVDDIEARPARDAIWETTHELRPGDSYTALVYDPEPSAAEMLRAGTAYPAEAGRYVSFSLSGGPGGGGSLQAPFWSQSGPAAIFDQVEGTPYEPMYALALSLATGADTPYEAARRIEIHLRNNYKYEQDVPDRDFPLPAFLAVDRAGYCQQFSGVMALMLRMLGIPSRVATGFAPGGRDPSRNTFLVDDSDAHDWVEVFFPGIGWVTFDPTPGAAPASTQSGDDTLGVTTIGATSEEVDASDAPDPRGGDVAAPKPTSVTSGAPGGGGSGPKGAVMLGGAAGAVTLAALVASGGYSLRRRRRARLDPRELVAAELGELAGALERLGSPLPPGATLLRTERRLERLAGKPGAAYAAKLREWRYRRPDEPPPDARDRRALRRALFTTGGRRSVIRVLRAIPPGGPIRR